MVSTRYLMDKKKLIKDFFEGKLSKVEAEVFLHWFLSEQAKKEIDDQIKEEWLDVDQVYPNYSWDGKELLKNIQKKQNTELSPSPSENYSVGKKKNNPKNEDSKIETKPARNKINYGWTASMVILIGSSLLFLYSSLHKSDKEAANLPEPTTIYKSNPMGQKSKINLPDGSIVYLNAESTLVYEEKFLNGRKVDLEGEAYFEISPDSLNPFKVISKNLATTALGTSFNIRAYKETDGIEVILSSGRVMVKDSLTNQSLILHPGEGTKVSGANESLQKHKVDLGKALLWKDGILHFEKMPFTEVVRTLERWYGVKITIAGRTPNEKCSGVFKKNEYLSNVLNVLSHSLEFEYAIKNKNVQIWFNPQNKLPM